MPDENNYAAPDQIYEGISSQIKQEEVNSELNELNNEQE